MWLVTSDEMRSLEQAAIQAYGIPSLLLMENAGLAVFHCAREIFHGRQEGKRVLILAGKGNNGGDGLVAARHLSNNGAEVKIFLLGKPEELQGDAQVNWQIVKAMGIPCQLIQTERDLNLLRVGLMVAELVVDAIFGTGFKGAVQGLTARLMTLVNEAQKPVLAVDLPSGVEANSGAVRGVCLKADQTVTLGLPKFGLLLEPAARFVGQLTVADISLPLELLRQQRFSRILLDESWCRDTIPVRPADSHKGDYGHVLVAGGSTGMSGAVTLAARAAVRAGAGLVTAAVPRCLNQIMAIKVTEAMSRPLPETNEGSLAKAALEPLRDLAGDKVLVIGPGLSRHKETGEMVRTLAAALPGPAVIDADALYALAGSTDLLRQGAYPVVLTPHPGEMAHLLGISPAEVQADRAGIALQAARDWRAVVVLKGAKTLVAAPSGNLYVCPTGNPGMATGGSGDVLAGLIGGLMAQGLPAEEAAAAAVYCHGLAGDAAAAESGMMGLAAGDLIHRLPEILKRFEGEVC